MSCIVVFVVFFVGFILVSLCLYELDGALVEIKRLNEELTVLKDAQNR